jgi:L-alanine-DL-glutamate epimerase-like enolase superfamily enzyme
VIEFLSRVKVPEIHNWNQLEAIIDEIDTIAPNNTSAKAAVDIALHDWLGKSLQAPLWKTWGLDKDKTPVSSFTIGIDTPDKIESKIKEAEEYPILKVKVGLHNDEEIIRTIRNLTNKSLRVDANEGWTSKEAALDKILWMEEQGVELIEQPMPASQLDDIAWLQERIHIPLIADESVKGISDIEKINGAFDGINIKLMKCGGLRNAMKMIKLAKKNNLKIMLGCMIETSVGIAAAANLSPLADYADLDGNLLISNDPFHGIDVSRGKLILRDRSGLGLRN